MARLTPGELHAKREQFLEDAGRRYVAALRRLELRSPGQLWPSYVVAESIGLTEPRTVDALVRRLRDQGLLRLEHWDEGAAPGQGGDAVALTARGRDGDDGGGGPGGCGGPHHERQPTVNAYLPALLGGLLVGLSAAVLLLLNGRIAGISGIVAGVVKPVRGDVSWRVLFLLGLVAGGWLMAWLRPGAFGGALPRSPVALAVAGVLVGAGVRLAGGCTSGHGLCGLSRFSRRSLWATLTFIATGAAATFVVNRWLGGAL